ncbi:aspartate kinase, partial [Candidatus Bathyarchaeota archaeon]|nr:aspartate kinase [Candidatus Bathyarchaeota archaeon]
NILVVKFGGSCLSTPDTINEAANKVAKEIAKGKSVVVVVSALSGTTDQLLGLAKQSSENNISKAELDELLSMGERTTARLMAGTLNSMGIKAIGLDPALQSWPIQTDSTFGNAEIRIEPTRDRVRAILLPLLKEGHVAVVPGFIGQSPEGKVTTLGRGGSDITAVLLGNCLEATEIVFVKDVDGVLSADPKKVASPKKIDTLLVDEAYDLAIAGAKIIQPKALLYKKESNVLRVVGFDASDLSGGTINTGELKVGFGSSLHPLSLSMITLITSNGSLPRIAKVLSEFPSAGSNILGLTVSESSILLYVQNPRNLVESLHDMIKREGIAKAIQSVDALAMVVVSGYGLEDMPGILEAVVEPLAKNGINLHGVFTISNSIRLFVPWMEREKALSAVKYVLDGFKKAGE